MGFPAVAIDTPDGRGIQNDAQIVREDAAEACVCGSGHLTESNRIPKGQAVSQNKLFLLGNRFGNPLSEYGGNHFPEAVLGMTVEEPVLPGFHGRKGSQDQRAAVPVKKRRKGMCGHAAQILFQTKKMLTVHVALSGLIEAEKAIGPNRGQILGVDQQMNAAVSAILQNLHHPCNDSPSKSLILTGRMNSQPGNFSRGSKARAPAWKPVRLRVPLNGNRGENTAGLIPYYKQSLMSQIVLNILHRRIVGSPEAVLPSLLQLIQAHHFFPVPRGCGFDLKHHLFPFFPLVFSLRWQVYSMSEWMSTHQTALIALNQSG